jgi:hypothetical protein
MKSPPKGRKLTANYASVSVRFPVAILKNSCAPTATLAVSAPYQRRFPALEASNTPICVTVPYPEGVAVGKSMTAEVVIVPPGFAGAENVMACRT